MKQTKRCPRCDTTKPLTNGNFCRSSASSNGFQGWCRDCANENQRERYARMVIEQEEAIRK